MKHIDWLIHYNQNHDPKNGQFTSKKGSQGPANKDIADQVRNKRMEDAYGAGLKEIKDDKGADDDKHQKKGLTEQQKKMLTVATAGAIAAVGITAGIVIAHRLHATEKIKTLLESGVTDKETFKDIMLEALDDESEVLKQGAKITRISFTPGEDITSRDGIAFAAYKPKDKAVYMTLLQDFAKSGESKRIMTYETVKDLKLPTEEKARKIFEALWNENPQYQESLKRTIREYMREVRPSLKNNSDKFVDQLSENAFGKNSGDMFYKSIWALVRRGGDSEIFINALREQGYDAIHDYHDMLDDLSEAPVILLNPKGSMVKRGEAIVSKVMKINTLKGLLKAGEKFLPTKSDGLNVISGSDGRLDIKKLMMYIKRGLI